MKPKRSTLSLITTSLHSAVESISVLPTPRLHPLPSPPLPRGRGPAYLPLPGSRLRDGEIKLSESGSGMGGLATEAEAPALDVSAEGTLLWLRRPNGSWWPSIVISPLDVPDGCAAPPRCPATPIMLLGRRDGATFVEWCNLDKCKRVKPFRCGELDFDQRITNAQALAAARIRGSTTKTYNKCRYARMEDAIIQALQIERARALEAESKSRHGDTCSAKPNKGNGVTTKSCSPHAAARDSSTVVQPPLPKRKRKTPYDSEDDAPTGSRRMRDLSDIGSKTVPMELSNAGTISVLNHDLPSVSQVKRSKQSPHSTAKRRHATADQDQPCGGSRKKDRSRPLSELCNGDMWNGFRSNGQKADEQIMGVGTCPTSSSGTSSLGTSLDKTSSHHCGAFKTDEAKGTEISCMTGLLKDDFRHGDDAVETPRTAGSILEADHLRTYQPFVLTKYPTWKHNKKSTDYSKADKSSQCKSGNFKVKTIITVDQEGNNGTRDALEHEHHETRAVKHKALSTGVVLLEKKPAKHSLNKPAEPGVNMHLAVFPADSDCVGAVQQQRSERNRDREESSETKSNGSNFENGSRPNLVFELPLQVLRPQQRALDLERGAATRRVVYLLFL
ncbi:uncharacterized protein At1g51745-like isoform X2 [Phragmites australis]|uniref:uncharacterized protein At1g51745-like isoform X2 n=1 Tax=Phragmites australis TaxID=29695 RepID=UPI002D78E57C|nr:uncharacterized protein At1g51745-like isoform X2 [Phragmites australis]